MRTTVKCPTLGSSVGRDELRFEDAINQTCPWSGKPIQADSLTLYKGRVVGFCNPGCRDKFAKAVDHFEAAGSREGGAHHELAGVRDRADGLAHSPRFEELWQPIGRTVRICRIRTLDRELAGERHRGRQALASGRSPSTRPLTWSHGRRSTRWFRLS